MARYSKTAVTVLLIFLCSAFTAGADAFEDELFGTSDQSESAFFTDDEEDLFGSSDEQSLFSEDGDFIVDVEQTDKSLDTLLLSEEDETVRIGGNFSFTAKPGFTWDYDDQMEGTFSGSIETLTFIDARVSDDVRVYSSFTYDHSLAENTFEFAMKEAFADLTFGDNIFIRAGKQIINWGVGYFFSPADVLNLSDIDPTNVSDDVEGPVAVKMNVSLGIDNLYAYVILPPSIEDPSDLAYAVKYEKVIGGTELGFGGYYRYDNPPSAQITFSSGIGEIALFGEGVLQYGSNKTFITGNDTTATYDDRFYFLGTVGGMYTYSSSESDFSLSAVGQYFYNGEGYEDTEMYDYVPSVLTQIELSDLLLPGRHYIGATLSASFTDDLGASVLVISNMTDFSGLVIPSITYSGIDNLSISLSANLNYGSDGTEYVFALDETYQIVYPRYLSPSLSITFGSISF
ncbi:MAG: hypothetical protein PQJ47_06915 [Sphaerochaetaceae bacterium]|nr:hypothetical protein [Sphaerochaetaceae bacterium]